MSTTSEEEAGVSEVQSPPPRPRDPPKIPPPPSEDPPPYTSHHIQTSALLNDAPNQPQPDRRSNNRIRPPGIHRFTQYLNKRNLIITLIALAIVLIAGLVLFIMSESAEGYEHETESIEGALPLTVKWKLLGEFKEHGQKLSFDENTDSLILSMYHPQDHELSSETLSIQNYMDGYTYLSSNITDVYQDCQRFTPDVFCCSTSKHGHVHRTDCWNGERERTIHTSASHYDFSSNWQSLYDDHKLVLIFINQRHAWLDLNDGRIYKIEENRLPRDFASAGFFFPMDNVQEMNELVRSGQEFRMCEYLRSPTGDYSLRSTDCKKTRFTVDFDLRKVKFCSNPIYTAVVQYGHMGEERDLTWRLRLNFDNNKDVYGTQEVLESAYEQLVLDCNDDTIEVYVVGKYEINQYTITLPDPSFSDSRLQTRLR
ncbi:unnamed protein product [Bursaphelenchus xylophilus]|uniref:(pine wood nematode) hypothetical protein n=1 Tax=Bursaphelenchus xylophilus TaxID=6326 RepID=A0A1I7RLP1_BURXY|nr:unnamed protein product [Bursaphelenchus xylophilus]CAG9082752.1 unnamed protein product [Bursaphelenchus xylophilus]